MKKILVLMFLLFLAMPVSAGTCRNGRMTIYHNSNYGYYKNNHVYNNAESIYQEKSKPIYGHTAIGSKPPVYTSSKNISSGGYMSLR